MSWSAFFCLIQFLKNKLWLELKRAALESFNGTFKVLTFLVTNIWNWPLMPAMGIDVLERDSTTQTWTSDKKKEGMGRSLTNGLYFPLFFFLSSFFFFFSGDFFSFLLPIFLLRKECCYFLYDKTLNNQLNGNTHRNVCSWLYPFFFSLVKSFFKGCQKFKHVPSDAHLRSLHTGYYQDNGK